MKLKYYLRGMGIGLLVGVLLMFAAIKILGYEKKDDKCSDKTEVKTEKTV